MRESSERPAPREDVKAAARVLRVMGLAFLPVVAVAGPFFDRNWLVFAWAGMVPIGMLAGRHSGRRAPGKAKRWGDDPKTMSAAVLVIGYPLYFAFGYEFVVVAASFLGGACLGLGVGLTATRDE